MSALVSFRVYGVPRPQGSKRALVRGGKAFLVESSKGLGTWREQVALAAREARPPALIDEPVELEVTFLLPAPKKPKWSVPAKVPDLSKLVRALEDELTGVVLVDDRLIVEIRAHKRWALSSAPGAYVTVRTVGG